MAQTPMRGLAMPALASVACARSMVRETKPTSMRLMASSRPIWVGDMDDPEIGRHQHHRHFRGAGQMGQHLGMAGKEMPGRMQSLLVEGRRADHIDLLRHRQLGGPLDIAIGGVAGFRRDLAERQIDRHFADFNHFDDAGAVLGGFRAGDGLDRQRCADDGSGLAQSGGRRRSPAGGSVGRARREPDSS